MQMMERVNRILEDTEYRKYYGQILECEKERIFCHHDMAHFLDVARLALIMSMKEGLGLSEELIYASGLLHDIGRHLQYLEGVPHEEASAELAPAILERCGFNETEIQTIVEAIRSHRDRSIADEKSLRGLIYRADKMSRSCFGCAAEQECNWSKEKKNMKICF